MVENISKMFITGPGVIKTVLGEEISMEELGGGLKQSEDTKDLVVRVLETEGKETMAAINLPVKVKSAQRLNLIEFSQKDEAKPEIVGNAVQAKPHEIVTLGIRR